MSRETDSKALNPTWMRAQAMIQHCGSRNRIPIAAARSWGLSTERAACLHSTGRLVENAFIELFIRRRRDGCLNVHQFVSLAEAQAIINA